jgi:hypothetical protein
MKNNAQTLDTKPITEGKGDLEIWDIDDSTLTDSFLDNPGGSEDSDPVLGNLNFGDGKDEDDKDEKDLDLNFTPDAEDETEEFDVDFDPEGLDGSELEDEDEF